MAPVYLNPPPDSNPYFQLADQKLKHDQHLQAQQLLHSSNRASASQDQRMINLEESQQHDEKVDECIAHGGSSDLQYSIQASKKMMNNISNNKLPIRKREVGEGISTSDNSSSSVSAKRMSSKMRLMHKMINSSNGTTATDDDESVVKVSQKLQNQLHDNSEANSFNNSNTTIRVCLDCNTTTTPLWRSGPRGPKSLCNACGIRKRKARRAMEAAAATGNGNNSALKQVFPQEVEEAAILLMELSCGFIHT